MLQGRLLLWGSHLESFKIALSICSMWWAGDCLCVSVYEGNFDSPESKEQIFAQSVILLWRNRQVEIPKGVTLVLQLPCPPLSQTTAGKSSLFPLQGSLEGLSIHPKPLELLSPFFPTQLKWYSVPGCKCSSTNAAMCSSQMFLQGQLWPAEEWQQEGNTGKAHTTCNTGPVETCMIP